MPGTQLNTFENGDVSTTSLSSIQQTLLQNLQSLDNVMLLNYDTSTACLGVKAGSVVTVNYVAYKFLSDELFNVLNSDGSVSTANSAANGDYYVIFAPDSDGKCTGYLRSIENINVIEDSDKGAIYENNTQYRIIGGLTKSGTSYTKKWRYEFKGYNLEKAGAWTIRCYADGIDLNPRRLAPSLYTSGLNKTVSVGWSASGLETGEISIATIVLTYPCYVVVNGSWSAISVPSGYKTTAQATGSYILVLMSGSTEIMTVSRSAPVLPGKYVLKLKTTVGRATDPRSHSMAITSSASVSSYSLYNSSGTRIGL